MDDKSILFYYQNCGGLRTKLHTLYMNILSNSYDIVILTETWLHPDISNSEFIDDRYQVFRKGRNRGATDRLDGGGVLVAVLRSFSATVRSGILPTSATPMADPLPAIIDYLMIDIRIANCNYIIGTVYIPPSQRFDHYYSLFNTLQSHLNNPNDTFIIIGDFNLPHLQWDCSVSRRQPILNDLNATHVCLSNFMSMHSCQQLNHILNVKGRILDLCLTNDTDFILSPALDPLVKMNEVHPPFQVLLPLQTSHNSLRSFSHIRYKYRDADYDKIKKELEKIEWTRLLSDKNVEQAITYFYELLYSVIKQYVPTKSVKSGSYPCWFTPELIHLHKKKKKAWMKMKSHFSESNYNVFSLYRHKFKVASERCYKFYIYKVEKSIKLNSKFFWTYVNNRKLTTGVPLTVNYKEKVGNTPEDICHLFSNFFKSVFEPSLVEKDLDISNIDIEDTEMPDSLLSEIIIDSKDIRNALKSLDVTKGAGVDNIPPCFLRAVYDVLDEPLCILFNKCLREGEFPRVWKSVRIVPVYKGGPTKDVENYRPISILPTLSKVFERLVHHATYSFLRNTIISQQHGFVKQRSTVTNMLIYTTYLFKGFEANTQIDSVYTDFRKAFDRVDHRILLEKLAFNGIRGNLWRWYKSYITNRTQKVVIKGYESAYEEISSGVPQGSILGPLLFILFINDINDCFHNCNFLLYADDLKIYRRIENYNDHIEFQNDLDRFSDYCLKNKLNLSLEKCKTITFTKKRKISTYPYSLDGTRLKRESIIKDLGITLDTKLHFDVHIENILNKAYRMYSFVIRSGTMFKQPSTYLQLFKTLVRSQIEYAVSVWNPLYDKYINKLESLQKKFLKCIHYKCARKRIPYDELLRTYKLLDLKSRRLQLEAMLLYDICHNRYDTIELTDELYYKVPTKSRMRSTRRHELFFTAACRTNAGLRCPIDRMQRTYNKLFNDLDIFAVSTSKFKKGTIELLNNNV